MWFLWIHGRPRRTLYEVSASMTLTVTSVLRSPIWQRSLIFPIGRVLLALNPKMLVSVALNLWAGIDKCSMTHLGICQGGARVHLKACDLRGADVSCDVKGSIMFLLNLHILWSEDNIGHDTRDA